jgi:hypothetical protein
MGPACTSGIEPAIEGADVVMMLRIQKERMGGGLFPNTREYSRYFGLNPRGLELAKPDAIVMHPGPMNRGVEIDPARRRRAARRHPRSGGPRRRRAHGRPLPAGRRRSGRVAAVVSKT